MSTILNRLIEHLDNRIARLRIAKIRLLDKNLEDKKLDHQLNRLVSMRNRLKSKGTTEDPPHDFPLDFKYK